MVYKASILYRGFLVPRICQGLAFFVFQEIPKLEGTAYQNRMPYAGDVTWICRSCLRRLHYLCDTLVNNKILGLKTTRSKGGSPSLPCRCTTGPRTFFGLSLRESTKMVPRTRGSPSEVPSKTRTHFGLSLRAPDSRVTLRERADLNRPNVT